MKIFENSREDEMRLMPVGRFFSCAINEMSHSDKPKAKPSLAE
jgi:hypothetical protein